MTDSSSTPARALDPDSAPDPNPHSSLPLPAATLVGFLIAFAAVLVIAWVSQDALSGAQRTNREVTQTLEIIQQQQALLSLLKDAETGQRGFLLTGSTDYLKPYGTARSALPSTIKTLRNLLADNPRQLDRLDALEQAIADKMDELGQTISLQRAGNSEGAADIVRSDRGRITMDRIRSLIADMENEERAEFTRRRDQSNDAARYSIAVSLLGSIVLLVLILVAAYLSSRDFRARETETWLRMGHSHLSAQLLGDLRIEQLGQKVLSFLAQYLGAQVGAFYLSEADGRLRRVAGHALGLDSGRELIRPGDGLLGQAARDGRAQRVRQVPEGYLPIASGLGQADPRELLISPAIADDVVHGVLELGFFRRLHPWDQQMLERASRSLGVAVRSARDRSRLEELLEETQRQGEELQTQQEELRVNNEELEEQTRALKESQAQLEVRQVELEQVNSRLEAQAAVLEEQRNDLEDARIALTDKAAELERSNQYKSEFLANMSHELRTPLNSTLILAKLLADNKDGNLSDEQVKFAQTIGSAGQDLLTLINDVLDLSKIEAGMVTVTPSKVPIAAAVDGVIQPLMPLARQKGLALQARIESEVPTHLMTDNQRLGQILKNLLSNALKFTDTGSVTLKVFGPDSDSVAFSVQDTGIGIPAHQHQVIFEAFRQVDGSANRKYGGTGLGLSISRDLAHLLGGRIEVQSTPGSGSVFTLTLPLNPARPPDAPGPTAAHLAVAGVHPMPMAPVSTARAPIAPATEAAITAPLIDDDRSHLSPDARLIGVIEDDTAFAMILRDLAHELGFQCIVAHTASEGLRLASTYRPHAILLDVNLPDHSGLGVLDQLKRDPATRHIPVHVVSVADYSHEALGLGAIGYALKPIKRDELVDAFKRLEAKFSQGVRRLLVVEDDARQLDSIRRLLDDEQIEIIGAESAGRALELLRTSNFDCMVMDLNLPDFSGYQLLEQMAEREDVAYPPVIVYTGRSLSHDEEQTLRRYSRSIILKDARSPERLLDEVTLFLHQVESRLPAASQRMLKSVRSREAILDGRTILIVEDDVRNIFALSSVLEPKGAKVEIARNGREALEMLARSADSQAAPIDLVLMDIMMPEMDGLTAMAEIRKQPQWRKLPIIALTAKAMRDDQEKCLAAGANDYIAKPLDVERLLSLVRVWIPK